MTLRQLVQFAVSVSLIACSTAFPTRRGNHLDIVVVEGPPKPELYGLELSAAQDVLAILHQLLGEPPSKPTDLQAARDELDDIKKRLGREDMLSLLAGDIRSGENFWRETAANASGIFVPARTVVRGLGALDLLNRTSFTAWLLNAGAGYPNALTKGHPYLYLEIMNTVDGKPASEVVESLGGGPIAHYMGGPTERQSFMPELPDYPTQIILAFTLLDGTLATYTHIASRDVSDGLELYLAVWLPDSTPSYIIKGEVEQLTIQLANWLQLAYSDLISGV
ncbi:hypothetical protein VTI74DRAFT_2348 [Chaetomium olivicolor]